MKRKTWAERAVVRAGARRPIAAAKTAPGGVAGCAGQARGSPLSPGESQPERGLAQGMPVALLKRASTTLLLFLRTMINLSCSYNWSITGGESASGSSPRCQARGLDPLSKAFCKWMAQWTRVPAPRLPGTCSSPQD